jgi:hypothetical protein
LRNTQSQKSKSTQFFFIKKTPKKERKKDRKKDSGVWEELEGVGGWLAGEELQSKYLISK